MELALLIDFGSTYTKVTAVDLIGEIVVGTARAFSTVKTGIMEGFLTALEEMEISAGLRNPPYKYKIACSSAAGGLRMIAVGLVPDLTVEAAKRAVLGAGARVIDVFAHELTKIEVGKIEEQNPDIILLAGGTDGGNRHVIIHNARMLAGSQISSPVVMAGNKTAADEVSSILTERGKDVYVTDNVMPELNVLNIDPARETIRKVFLRKIVVAKGLTKAEQYIDRVLMPTPAAVLKASELLSRGYNNEAGVGELMVVDVGGATTDVYSLGAGNPTKPGVSLKGLPEPFAKRTVEGDLGMRYSAETLVEAAGFYQLSSNFGITEQDMREHVGRISSDPGMLCKDDDTARIDTALAYAAVNIATDRHVGRLDVIYTPFGASYIQMGKDLTQVSCLVGTGGVIVFHPKPRTILEGAVFDKTKPAVLKPIAPRFLVDRDYIMAAVGLLAEVEPLKSLRIMKKYLVEI